MYSLHSLHTPHQAFQGVKSSGLYTENTVHKNITNITESYVGLHDHYANTYNRWTVGFILYCYILFYYLILIH